MNMVRKVLSVAAVLFALLAGAPVAQAGQVLNGTITAIHLYGSSTTPVAAITYSGSLSGSPACATIPQIYMYADLSTAKGRALLSLATSAMLAGKRVNIFGTNTCAQPSGGLSEENINYIQVFNN